MAGKKASQGGNPMAALTQINKSLVDKLICNQ